MTDNYRQRVAEALLALLRRTVPSEYDLADAVLAVPNPEVEKLRKQIAILDRLDRIAIDDWAQANRELKAEVVRLRVERDAARATRDETHVWTNTDWKERAERAEVRVKGLSVAVDRVLELHRMGDSGSCVHCSENDYPNYSIAWPCPTVRALDPKEET